MLKTNLYEKLAEYKEIAKQNPNKFYIAIIRPQVLDIYFPNNMYNTFFIGVNMQTKVGENEESKEENLKEIKGEYRYYNVGFYGSPGDYYFTSTLQHSYTEEEWIELPTLQKIDIDKYYDENLEYKDFINQVIKNELSKDSIPFEELKIERITYDFKKERMIVNFKENEYDLVETIIYFSYR